MVKSSTNENLLFFHKFWTHFNIDCMAIGAMFALLANSTCLRIQSIVCNNWSFLSTTSVCVILISLGIYIPSFHFETYAVLFGVIIYNLANNQHLKNILEGKTLNHLGEISYGLYMFHPTCIVITINSLKALGLVDNVSIIYLLSIALSYFTARISYTYYERFFLSLKELYNR